MNIDDFDFPLPPELIAQQPEEKRENSKLLLGINKKIEDHSFIEISHYFEAGDVIVINNTKVIKARLFGKKSSGGKIELLIERVLDDFFALAHINASKSPKPGSEFTIDEEFIFTVKERKDDLFLIQLSKCKTSLTIWDILEKKGSIPLPPYIHRQSQQADEERYQTVYAKEKGAVAAPTAGLHFTNGIIQQLKEKGIIFAEVTLHVGAGTFQPVRVKNIEDHKMHSERFTIPKETQIIIQTAQKNGKKVCAVGTTTLRALESATYNGELKSISGETSIFIKPGYQFQIVDILLTNFHLPKSTLLMLVSAFSGYDHIQNLYKHAIDKKYRFFSYGDAMLLDKRNV